MTILKQFQLLLLLIIFGGALSVKAQKRVVDMIPVIESPAVGDTLYNGEESLLRVSVKNLGPDDLVNGDTLFMNVVSAGRIVQLIIETDIPSGATGIVMESNTFSMQIDPQSSGVRGDFCMQLMDPEKNSITRNGVPVITTYEDPDISNNVSCNMITVLNREKETSITKKNSEEDIAIFPNPASTEINIKLSEIQSPRALCITDVSGREMLRINTLNEENYKGQLKLDVSHFSSGIYIIKINTDNLTIKSKFIINR